MQGKFLIAAVTVLLIVIVGPPATAQQQSRKSRGGHVVLIARMPETFSLALNSGAPPTPFTETTHQIYSPIASTMTTSWVLATGRDRVVVWAQVKRPPSPALFAFASPPGVPGYDERTEDSFSDFHLPRLSPAKGKISRLDSLTITDANRASTNTICLSDSIDPEEPRQLLNKDYVGVIKIKIQAVP